MSRITLANIGDAHLFAVGDRVSGDGSELVVAIDYEHNEIVTARATWWRRFRYWAPAQLRRAWWWLRCTWGALRMRDEDS